jgi:Raf kinase inhibitor-like YbhB/YbcL family protein
MMKKITFFISVLALFTNSAYALKLTSESIQNRKYFSEKHVFNGFGCTGKNISPQLSWTDAPKETKSFAITAYDPDAPTGSGWWHWVVFNIPTSVTSIAEGIKPSKWPEGVIQSNTDFGKPGFGGACPPKGDEKHRYIFKVFALNADKLPLNSGVTAATVGFYINNHKIDEAQIKGYYKR